MIRARFTYKNERLFSFRASGHAEFALKGSDIVCAAFVALSRTTERYLNMAGALASHETGSNELFFEALDQEERRAMIAVAFDMLLLGIRDLTQEFPLCVETTIERI